MASSIRRVLDAGALASDTDQDRIAKEVFVVIVLSSIVAGTVWAVTYTALGRPLTGLIPLVISIVSGGLFGRFLATKRLGDLALPMIALMVVLPLALQLSLGGFVDGSAVVMWAFSAPLSALLLRPARETALWLLAFLGALVTAAIFDSAAMQAAAPLAPIVRNVLFGFNIAGVGTFTFITLSYFRAQRDASERRSESLLLNVLPASIARRLKRGEELIADHHDEITVLFADLAGFTVRSANEAPTATVAVLNDVFSAFDELARRYRLEKIRTIGDSYMVAAGVPEPRADDTHAICGMALDLQQEVKRLNAERGWDLHFRIGVNCGPAVAGIVGREKFHYDVWGDTVNVASRMESHGLADQIQVTAAVVERAQDAYVFKERGLIDVKGKGPTLTYLLLGRVASSRIDAPETAQVP